MRRARVKPSVVLASRARPLQPQQSDADGLVSTTLPPTESKSTKTEQPQEQKQQPNAIQSVTTSTEPSNDHLKEIPSSPAIPSDKDENANTNSTVEISNESSKNVNKNDKPDEKSQEPSNNNNNNNKDSEIVQKECKIENHNNNNIKIEKNSSGTAKKPLQTRRLIKPIVCLPIGLTSRNNRKPPTSTEKNVEDSPTQSNDSPPPTPTSSNISEKSIKSEKPLEHQSKLMKKLSNIDCEKNLDDKQVDAKKSIEITNNEDNNYSIKSPSANINNNNSIIEHNFKSPLTFPQTTQMVNRRPERINSPANTAVLSPLTPNPPSSPNNDVFNTNNNSINFNDENLTKSPSSSKIRQRIKPTPCFGTRRNSIQGNTSESEEETVRQHRTRHISTSSNHSTNISNTQYDNINSPSSTIPQSPKANYNSGIGAGGFHQSNRIRTESTCSNISDANTIRGGDGGVSKTKFNRNADENHKTNEAIKRALRFHGRTPNKNLLTMYDLIYYNPVTNPMKNPAKSKSAESKKSIKERRLSSGSGKSVSQHSVATSIKSEKSELSQKSIKSEKTDAMPVPQLKLGPNGEIILDEKSLVIESKVDKEAREVLAKSEVVYDDEFSGTSGFYKRRKRSKLWSYEDTIRFYRSLHTIGTDFSLMTSLFPNRSRQELKTKFKIEEKRNTQLVYKALLHPKTFNIEDLKSEFEEEAILEELRATKWAEDEKRRKERKKQLYTDKKNCNKNMISRSHRGMTDGEFIYENEFKKVPKHRKRKRKNVIQDPKETSPIKVAKKDLSAKILKTLNEIRDINKKSEALAKESSELESKCNNANKSIINENCNDDGDDIVMVDLPANDKSIPFTPPTVIENPLSSSVNIKLMPNETVHTNVNVNPDIEMRIAKETKDDVDVKKTHHNTNNNNNNTTNNNSSNNKITDDIINMEVIFDDEQEQFDGNGATGVFNKDDTIKFNATVNNNLPTSYDILPSDNDVSIIVTTDNSIVKNVKIDKDKDTKTKKSDCRKEVDSIDGSPINSNPNNTANSEKLPALPHNIKLEKELNCDDTHFGNDNEDPENDDEDEDEDDEDDDDEEDENEEDDDDDEDDGRELVVISREDPKDKNKQIYEIYLKCKITGELSETPLDLPEDVIDQIRLS